MEFEFKSRSGVGFIEPPTWTLAVVDQKISEIATRRAQASQLASLSDDLVAGGYFVDTGVGCSTLLLCLCSDSKFAERERASE